MIAASRGRSGAAGRVGQGSARRHGPAGLALYRGDKFPAWNGDLFVGALAFKHLRRVHLDERGEVAGQEQFLNDLHWRIRDVRASPDGYLYVCTDDADGRVLRLEPAN